VRAENAWTLMRASVYPNYVEKSEATEYLQEAVEKMTKMRFTLRSCFDNALKFTPDASSI
jgi:hypothetical protein